ncbi:MAG TPA: zinc-dependent metalloprotease, partial [Acidobacteriaceae bacterium]|nr:zinc-dependent metalloprotease [Acidobacteriaceae bacterium]
MLRFLRFGFVLALAALATASIHADTIAQKTAGMHHMDGYFPLDYDAKAGKLYLTIDKFNTDFLYLDQLPNGLGQNDIGLDRGQLGEQRLVRFERFGPKVLLVQPNLKYRSSATDAAERSAVTQSFPESVVWGFKVEAEDDAKVLVDATEFFLHDAHGVAETLQRTQQGQYKLDASRSALADDNTRNFPLNTEVEAILTFATDAPPAHNLLAEVTPDAHSVTVREHHSLIALPDAGYQPRAFDPRAGYFPFSYRDYTAPLGSSIDVHFIPRHRLQKKDPNAAISDPIKPLTYYVDRGAPEPIRTALVEGARWWNQAFEAAGFRNAFRVEVLPDGADPMDIRYNMIQWVHRSTRGWSYGASVIDPRTGEIIKGQVTLGSLRGRQDYLIAESLLSPYVEGKPIPTAMQEMVLARIRQLAAHEVGHTLGLAHNFAASSFSQGASVMDYPHPYIALDAHGNIDLSHAYATGIGEWDKVAIRYGYSQFSASSEPHELSSILTDAQARRLYFITDEDSRPMGSAHPHAHLWDNGADPASELDRVLKIRSVALSNFSANAIRAAAPMATLEDTLVPVYLLHRYQTEAAAKEIGGLDYRYSLRGDHQLTTAIVPPDQQRHALQSVLKTLDPSTLTLPESLLKNLPPRPPAYPRTRESFP